MAEEQSPETKAAARQFMSDMISGPPPPVAFTSGGGVDMAAWKTTYKAATCNSTLMEQFWSIYDPSSTSIWTMVYDEADSNENLNDTIQMVKEFLEETEMESIRDHCFGVVHTLESLEIEGLWFFNGPDPEKLFGANEGSSWYTWSQVGPDANEMVKKVVADLLTPTDDRLSGRVIKDTQTF